MKKILLSIALLSVYQLQAQFSYTLTTLNQPYQNLTGATVLTLPDWDFGFTGTVNIGFSFPYFDQTFNSNVSVMEGEIYFGVVGNESYDIDPFNDNMQSRGSGLSPISYLVTGSAGNKILKVEWKNAGFYNDPDTSQFFNIQAWLYENGTIEFRYGANKVNSANMSNVEVALLNVAPVNEILHVTGNPANPVLVNQTGNLNSAPQNGTVYKFTKNTTGIINLPVESNSSNLFPNPARNEIFITGNFSLPAQIELYDITGRKIFSKPITDYRLPFTISSLSQGIYVYEIRSGAQVQRGKLLKE